MYQDDDDDEHTRSQRERLLRALRDARADGRPVTVPEILAMGIAAFGRRISELRQLGCVIRNRMRRGKGGKIHSDYHLVFDPWKERR